MAVLKKEIRSASFGYFWFKRNSVFKLWVDFYLLWYWIPVLFLCCNSRLNKKPGRANEIHSAWKLHINLITKLQHMTLIVYAYEIRYCHFVFFLHNVLYNWAEADLFAWYQWHTIQTSILNKSEMLYLSTTILNK